MTANIETTLKGTTAKRRRSILLARCRGAECIESALSGFAEKIGAELLVTETGGELSSFARENRDRIRLIVLVHDVPDLPAGARQCVAIAPQAELIFLATEEDRAELLRCLGPAPRLGTHWSFVDPNTAGLDRVLRSAYLRADQRCATRTTLDRFNARLNAPAAPVDTGELRQLILSDRFLSSLLESAFDAVVLIDQKGVVTAFNPAAERLFERSKADILSSPAHGVAGGSWSKSLTLALDDERVGELIVGSIETRGGGQKEIEISATPIFDRNGIQIATSVMIRDVTQRVLAENALRTSEKLAAVGRLASSIAHEINNPLESVTNLIYLARHSPSLAEAGTYLDAADEELRRVAAITSQTLRFHRQASEPTLVTSEQLLESVLSIYQGKMRSAGVVLELRLKTEKPILCLEGEVRQVLNNLVGNAIDAMGSQGRGGRLLIRSRNRTDPGTSRAGLSLTVADNGVGMTADTVEKIFEPFYTTKGATGSGLGLWISQEIIARHHGTLRVRSRVTPGRSGTVFEVFLPFDGLLQSFS